MNEKNITTKRMLKRFLGSDSYISDHLPYSTKLLHKLRLEGTGVNNLAIKWTDVLIKELDNVKSKINKSITLHPVDRNKEIHGVVDTSYHANAAFFYQLDGTKKNFIKLFSRRRSDCDNKRRPSSCEVELTGLLAAMLLAAAEIEQCDKTCIMYTDSQSVAMSYEKLGVRHTYR